VRRAGLGRVRAMLLIDGRARGAARGPRRLARIAVTAPRGRSYWMITRIGHVAIRITDLERTLDFYCPRAGLPGGLRLDREGQPSPWIVYLQLRPGQFLSLFPGGEGEAPPRGRRPATTTPASRWTKCARRCASWRRGASDHGRAGPGTDHNWQ